MQAAASLCFTAPLPVRDTKSSSSSSSSFCRVPRGPWSTLSSKSARLPAISAVSATPAPETSTVDYSSTSSAPPPASVFPAEACETIGGDACNVEMFPEVKPASQAATRANLPVEEVDREYLDYSEPRTVFPGEACDDLGGEFCEAEYQAGVYREQLQAK